MTESGHKGHNGRDQPADGRRRAAAGPDVDLFRTSDVASLFQVSSRTVSDWARRGRIPSMRTPGGQWRYPAEPIRQLLREVHHPTEVGDVSPDAERIGSAGV